MNSILETKEFLDKLTSVVPTQKQIDFQNLEYYNFIHFGLNTFTKKEWGDGKADPQVFTVRDINTDKWVLQLKATGSKGIIITAKHHDGFCLFASEYTDYNITKTSYKDGKGDLVKDLAESCRKHGMKMGIYLSPWNRHESTYGTEEYNDYFCNQLTELCTSYGDIFCFWFDGACGEGPNGKKQRYDWERYFEIINRLQPDAVIANCGPDVRWIGNEQGKGRESEYSVVSTKLRDRLKIAEMSQQQEGVKVMSKMPAERDRSLGEREQLIGEELCWYPAEMDISITEHGWFWRKSFELFKVRSVDNLMQCYYESVGNNATLLLNVAPNNKGELPRKYIKRLMQFKARLDEQFGNEIADVRISQECNTFILKLPKSKVRTVVICEDINHSQRIEKFRLTAEGETIYSGTAVGFKKICNLNNEKEYEEICLKIDKCRNEPYLHRVRLYK